MTSAQIPSADLCLFLESMRIFKRPFDIASASCLNFFVASPKTDGQGLRQTRHQVHHRWQYWQPNGRLV
jgi:hypothetical protein